MPIGAVPVSGFGNQNAKLLLVGEALGEDEVLLGEPFVGMAGKYLNKMLSSAGIERHNIYITNIVSCRPTKNDAGKTNRPPSSKEINACLPWTLQEIEEIRPSVVVPLGLVPTKALLGKVKKLDDLVGSHVEKDGRIFFPCYHPSYLMGRRKDLTSIAIDVLVKARKRAYGH